MKMKTRGIAESVVDGVLMGIKGEIPEPGGYWLAIPSSRSQWGGGGGVGLPLSRNWENFSMLIRELRFDQVVVLGFA